ncbi:hypothetical protein Bbelb_018440 [Branchiostoma belcheri]|nr:hypothetical protein Bbelb_018440 [Branchiostoma belcheri]
MSSSAGRQQQDQTGTTGGATPTQSRQTDWRSLADAAANTPNTLYVSRADAIYAAKATSVRKKRWGLCKKMWQITIVVFVAVNAILLPYLAVKSSVNSEDIFKLSRKTELRLAELIRSNKLPGVVGTPGLPKRGSRAWDRLALGLSGLLVLLVKMGPWDQLALLVQRGPWDQLALLVQRGPWEQLALLVQRGPWDQLALLVQRGPWDQLALLVQRGPWDQLALLVQRGPWDQLALLVQRGPWDQLALLVQRGPWDQLALLVQRGPWDQLALLVQRGPWDQLALLVQRGPWDQLALLVQRGPWDQLALLVQRGPWEQLALLVQRGPWDQLALLVQRGPWDQLALLVQRGPWEQLALLVQSGAWGPLALRAPPVSQGPHPSLLDPRGRGIRKHPDAPRHLETKNLYDYLYHTDLNECTRNPCQHGRCVNKDGGYKCTCNPGWTGQNCEQDLNECDGNPCEHGRCVNNDGGYKCACNSGWTGQNCQQDLNECTGNPCKHGRCVNKDGGYKCTCNPGWTGRSCHLAKPCRVGWSGYKNHCYKLMKDKAKWEEAKKQCEQLGANLASITSRDEAVFINTIIAGAPKGEWGIHLVWFGLRRKDGLRKFTDGSPVSYTNWQPNDKRHIFSVYNRQDCVGIVAGAVAAFFSGSDMCKRDSGMMSNAPVPFPSSASVQNDKAPFFPCETLSLQPR